jgi:hypothetical protein
MNFLQLVGQMFGQLPASNSPEFKLNSLDWAKIARELVMILIPMIPPLLGYRYEFNGKDFTPEVVIGLRLLLQWAKQWAGGQPKA